MRRIGQVINSMLTPISPEIFAFFPFVFVVAFVLFFVALRLSLYMSFSLERSPGPMPLTHRRVFQQASS